MKNSFPTETVRAEIEKMFGEPVTIVTKAATTAGAALYRVEGNENGEVRYYVEGETGELLPLAENMGAEEAIEEFRKL